jgi:hypothetical protein
MSWRMFQNSATCVVVLIWLQMLSTVDYGLRDLAGGLVGGALLLPL